MSENGKILVCIKIHKDRRLHTKHAGLNAFKDYI